MRFARIVYTAFASALALTFAVTGLTPATAASDKPASTPTATPTPTISRPPTPELQAAITALQENPPLFVQHNAPLAINEADQAKVIAAAQAARTPFYIAIMTRRNDGVTTASARALGQGVGHGGTYLSIAGTSYTADSTVTEAKPLLAQAFREQRADGTAAVILRFIELVQAKVHGTTAAPITDFPWLKAGIVAGVAAILGGLFLLGDRRRKQRQAAAEAAAAVNADTTSVDNV